MEQKQTAVDWLIDELSKFEKGESEYFSTTIIKNKAIRMEKQQIIDANEDASTNELGEFLTGEQYYKQEYGK